MERTEEQKLVQAPVKVILGSKEYEIKPLPIKYSLPWVKKVADMSLGLFRLTKLTTDNDDVIKSALSQVMIEDPAKLINLFFEYARDLKQKEIEETASSMEIVKAFEEVLELERPLLQMAITVAKKAMPAQV